MTQQSYLSVDTSLDSTVPLFFNESVESVESRDDCDLTHNVTCDFEIKISDSFGTGGFDYIVVAL